MLLRLLVWNSISFGLSLIVFISIYRDAIPPANSEAVRWSVRDLSRDQIISQLINGEVAFDHAYNMLWFFLWMWLGTGLLNIILIIYALKRSKKNIQT
jgi:hypothetical protein